MAKNQNTFAKRQREFAKKQKAEAKRARRNELKKLGGETNSPDASAGDDSEAENDSETSIEAD